MTAIKTLCLVLGDQVTPEISSLAACDREHTVVLMAEVAEEATYVRHHKKKIAFLFAAMRHFAAELEQKGWPLRYVRLNDRENQGSLEREVARAVADLNPERILVTEPGEHRLRTAMDDWQRRFNRPVEILPDDRFLCSIDAFRDWADGRKTLRMESFYREMRRRAGLLMTKNGEPEGGRWNFDTENRKPAGGDLDLPKLYATRPDETTQEVIDLVADRFCDHFGDLEPFRFAVTRAEAGRALDAFIDRALPCFGDYQDAMLAAEDFLFHSVLSMYLNCGLLDPMSVCRRAERAYYEGHAPLNAVEGFIRQILGWREFIRGIYWLHMPGYTERNHFNHSRALPDFYWTGETDMRCLAEAVRTTREHAYAHHIQRLMITGNFALLAGLDPGQVQEWYLIVYADAYEWVEAPNVVGMALYADGGVFASKPYAAGGNYINKMSDYCSGCAYDVKTKTGATACPFNYLYWDFLGRNEASLKANQRLRPIYSTWGRMKPETQQAYRDSAGAFLRKMEQGKRV
ncbi:MAG: cryptochrome/photolyase family protein [Rhodothalassiaceae bacterium]